MSARDDSQSSSQRSRVWLAGLPIALGLLAALPVLLNGALFDDELLIFSNPYAQSLRYLPENLSRDFFFSATGQPIGYYRPGSKLLFMLEYQLFSARPFGYHAVSLAALAALIAIAWRLARQLEYSQRAAALALCLFATHPATARTVATIASQSDLFCAAALLACLGASLRYARSAHTRWLARVLFWESTALAFKETALLAPLLLWIASPRRKPTAQPHDSTAQPHDSTAQPHDPTAQPHDPTAQPHDSTAQPPNSRAQPAELPAHPSELPAQRRAAWSGVPRLVCFSVLPVLAYLGLRAALGVMPIEQTDAHTSAVVASTAKLWVSGLLRAFAPLAFNPALHTDRPADDATTLAFWLASALVLLGALLFGFARARSLRLPLALVGLPIALLLAGASAIHITEDPQALVLSDRWLLLPALGAALVLGQWIELALSRLERPPLRAAVLLGVSALFAMQALVTAEENASYRDENTRVVHLAALYRETPDPPHDAPEVLLAADAIAAERQGDRQAAVRAHAALLERKPEDSVRRYNLAHALFQAGDLRAALAQAHLAFHARALDGSQPYPENDSTTRRRAEKALLLGLILERLGEGAAAARYREVARELNPALATRR